MGMIGTLYHGIKGTYNLIAGDSDVASRELDKAVDSLHRTISVDPIGISDVSDIVDDVSD